MDTHHRRRSFSISIFLIFVFADLFAHSLDQPPTQIWVAELPKTPGGIQKLSPAQFRISRQPLPISNSIEDPANYDFEYQIYGGGNYFGHAEKRAGIETNGQYFVVLPDFRRQLVKYYVDSSGYHASVTYEPIGLAHPLKPRDGTLPIANQVPGFQSKGYKKVVRKRVPKRRRSHQSGIAKPI